jgi:hypothetical protein
VRAIRKPVPHTETVPLQMPMASELLDASSTATITVLGSQDATIAQYIPDWNALHNLTFTTLLAEFQHSVAETTENGKRGTTATANREVLVEGEIQLTPPGVLGIFVAAKPARRRLFELRLAIPQGGLPKRKPFVWIPKDLSEE